MNIVFKEKSKSPNDVKLRVQNSSSNLYMFKVTNDNVNEEQGLIFLTKENAVTIANSILDNEINKLLKRE